jgi:predicted RNA-binding Zn ribbon-like protein
MTKARALRDSGVASGAAPGELELVRAFVNTLDIEQGTDELAGIEGLTGWLRRWSAAGGPAAAADSAAAAAAGPGDLERAVALREALRGVLRCHARPQASELELAAAELRRAASGLQVQLDVAGDGSVGLAPAPAGPAGTLARILLIAATAAAQDTWPRLKACAAGDCQWAFYDRSPTRSGCWCSMRICGARAKSRSYRQRAAGRQDPG